MVQKPALTSPDLLSGQSVTQLLLLGVGCPGWSVDQSCLSVAVGDGRLSWVLPWPISTSISLWLHGH